MPYEPGTMQCRIVLDSIEKLITIQADLDRLEGVDDLRKDIRAVTKRLHDIHTQLLKPTQPETNS